MNSVDDDTQLMVRYREGDLAAFEALYARHKGPLYRYLLRNVRSASAASDLFQEVWSRVIATRARYQPRAKFTTFLFHIAHNCAMDHFRRDRTRRQTVRGETASYTDLEVPEHQHPDRMAEFDEQQSELLAALATLPIEQREAFLLHAESGLDLEGIARVTAVPFETAKSRLRYAVRKLQSHLCERSSPERAAATPVRALWKPVP